MKPTKLYLWMYLFFISCAVLASWMATSISELRLISRNKTISIQAEQIESLEKRVDYLYGKVNVNGKVE